MLHELGTSRAASLRTRRASFRCTGLSSDLCRVRDGVRVDVLVACRADDEGLAPHSCHERGPRGLGRPGPAEVAERGDLVNGHRGAVLAQLAPPLAEPVDQLLAGIAGPGRGGVIDDRAPVLPEGDPAEACYFACAPSPCGPPLTVARLAGRYPGDYCGHSVAIGLASRRRSHVHNCYTC
jgi:hypothetical protein